MAVFGEGLGDHGADLVLNGTRFGVGEGEGCRCLAQILEAREAAAFMGDAAVDLLA